MRYIPGAAAPPPQQQGQQHFLHHQHHPQNRLHSQTLGDEDEHPYTGLRHSSAHNAASSSSSSSLGAHLAHRASGVTASSTRSTRPRDHDSSARSSLRTQHSSHTRPQAVHRQQRYFGAEGEEQEEEREGDEWGRDERHNYRDQQEDPRFSRATHDYPPLSASSVAGADRSVRRERERRDYEAQPQYQQRHDQYQEQEEGEWQQQRARRSTRSYASASASSSSSSSQARQPAASTSAPTTEEGYNSDDERRARARQEQVPDLANILRREKGWQIVRMAPDGACLFRAIAYHLFGDQELHGDVRKQCMDYMERNQDHFAQFVTEPFATYIARKREPGCYGNHLEIQAMSELYNRNIEVYVDSSEPINTFLAHGSTDPPIRVSYHNNIHYNAIMDPNLPAFGVGLGFSDIRPGEPDRLQMEQALRESEQEILERELIRQLEEEAELQRAQAEIEAAILAESRRGLAETEEGDVMDEIEAAILAESRQEYYRSLANKQS